SLERTPSRRWVRLLVKLVHCLREELEGRLRYLAEDINCREYIAIDFEAVIRASEDECSTIHPIQHDSRARGVVVRIGVATHNEGAPSLRDRSTADRRQPEDRRSPDDVDLAVRWHGVTVHPSDHFTAKRL